MTKGAKSTPEGLGDLPDNLVEDLMSLSDEEILKEANELLGGDVEKMAATFRANVSRLITEVRKRRLAAARESYRKSATIVTPVLRSKMSIEEMLAKLRDVLSSRNDVPRDMVLAFRERNDKDWTEDELASMLDDMAEMGLIDKGNNDT